MISLNISDSTIEDDLDQKDIQAILSNFNGLKSFLLTSSDIIFIEKNAFSGVPSLEELNLSGNSKLAQLDLASMPHLTTINLMNDIQLSSLKLSDLPKLNSKSIKFEKNQKLSHISLNGLPGLVELNTHDIGNKESLSLDISNCTNLHTLNADRSNLVKLHLEDVD